MIPKVNSAHGSETRNIINRAIEVLNRLGIDVQTLVADGQLTPAQYAELITTLEGLLKGGDVDLNDFNERTRAILQGLNPGDINAVLGKGNVTIENLSRDVWRGLNRQNAKRAIEDNPNNHNLVFGADGTKTVDEIVNNTTPSFSTLQFDGNISGGIYEIDAGGFYFYQIRVGPEISLGDSISFAVKLLSDRVGLLKAMRFRDLGGNDIGDHIPLNNAGDGWYFLEDVKVPAGAHTIQLRLDNRFGDTVPIRFQYPVIQKGKRINDAIYAPSDLVEKTAELEKSLNAAQAQPPLKRMIPYVPPKDFRWWDDSNPIYKKIYHDGEGNFAVVGFDIMEFFPQGKTYYVDRHRGADQYAGTKERPFRTVKKAYEQSDVKVIKVNSGVYPRAELFYETGGINKEVAIMAEDDAKVIFHSGNPIRWSKTSGRQNVYEGTRGGSLQDIIDYHVFDEKGDPKFLEKVSSISAVDSAPGRYYHDTSAGTVYVHTYGSEIPDDSFLWALTEVTTLPSLSGKSIYLKGLEVYGGQGCVHQQSTSSSDLPLFIAKDCKFKYTSDAAFDAVMLQGAALTVIENCEGAIALKDGFNYHWRYGIAPLSIEIDCIGRHNGNVEDANDQGSTTHDGGSIIRVNGAYYGNEGANIAEDASVGDASTQSLNLGCSGFESATSFETRNINFHCYNNVDMWVDGCIGYGSNYNLGGNVKVRNSKFSGELAFEGSAIENY